jgi:hypothetical protein
VCRGCLVFVGDDGEGIGGPSAKRLFVFEPPTVDMMWAVFVIDTRIELVDDAGICLAGSDS